MKKYVITSSALLVAMAICLVTTHATTHILSTITIRAASAASQDAPPKGQMGKVAAIDTAKSELMVKDERGAEKAVSIGPTTKITKDGKDIALADVKIGDRVMYELDTASDPPIAKSLRVMSMKSAKP